jgi:NAD(P)-dependent dehydrogenase (short-subunit alcohol dehydrogenase family)
MANQPLAGQVAVITGGGRGIGLAISDLLATLGASTVLVGRREATLESAAKKIREHGQPCLTYVADVCRMQDIEELGSFVDKEFSRTDILVNNAGVGCFGKPLHETDPQDWEDTMNTNLRGVYYCIRTFAPLMIRENYGHIVNISSIASKNALPKGAAYATSKWALNGLSYSVAEELRNNNIRVSVVCPGSTSTELSPHTGKDVKKMLKPADVAHVVAMLVTQAPESFASEVILRPTQKP